VIWRQLPVKLRQSAIALLKKGLRVLEPELEFENSTRRFVQREVLEGAVKTGKSCSSKTNELCMFAGTVQGDEQALEFVQEDLNLNTVQIDAEIARSQEEMKTEESNRNIGEEREGLADDWSRAGEGMENCVKYCQRKFEQMIDVQWRCMQLSSYNTQSCSHKAPLYESESRLLIIREDFYSLS